MIKSVKIFLLTIIAFQMANAQTGNVTNAILYNMNGKLDMAKAEIDLASQNAEKNLSPKVWMVRGDVYLSLANNINPSYEKIMTNAAKISYDAYNKALDLDEQRGSGKIAAKVNNKIKGLYEPIVKSGDKLYEKAIKEAKDANFDTVKYSKHSNYYDLAIANYEVAMTLQPKDTLAYIKSYYAAEQIAFNAPNYSDRQKDGIDMMMKYGNILLSDDLSVEYMDTTSKKLDTVPYYQYNQKFAKRIYNSRMYIYGTDKLNDLEQVGLLLDEMSTKYPDDQNLVGQKINYLLKTKQSDKAFDLLKTEIAKFPDNIFYNYFLAFSYMQVSTDDTTLSQTEQELKFDTATQYYDKVFSLDNKDRYFAKAKSDLARYYYKESMYYRKKVGSTDDEELAKTYKEKSFKNLVKAQPFWEYVYDNSPSKRAYQFLNNIYILLEYNYKTQKNKEFQDKYAELKASLKEREAERN